MTNAIDLDDRTALVDALADLRREIVALSDRVAALEQVAAADRSRPPSPASGPAHHASPSPEAVTPDIIAVITAALAAYLGVKPHIRQISVVGGAAWAQQGRVTIQASHLLAIQRD